MSEYTKVTCIIIASTERAIAFIRVEEKDNDSRNVFWVPKSLIHGGDLIKLEEITKGDTEVTFRLMDWKAEELDL